MAKIDDVVWGTPLSAIQALGALNQLMRCLGASHGKIELAVEPHVMEWLRYELLRELGKDGVMPSRETRDFDSDLILCHGVRIVPLDRKRRKSNAQG